MQLLLDGFFCRVLKIGILFFLVTPLFTEREVVESIFCLVHFFRKPLYLSGPSLNMGRTNYLFCYDLGSPPYFKEGWPEAGVVESKMCTLGLMSVFKLHFYSIHNHIQLFKNQVIFKSKYLKAFCLEVIISLEIIFLIDKIVM